MMDNKFEELAKHPLEEHIKKRFTYEKEVSAMTNEVPELAFNGITGEILIKATVLECV